MSARRPYPSRAARGLLGAGALGLTAALALAPAAGAVSGGPGDPVGDPEPTSATPGPTNPTNPTTVPSDPASPTAGPTASPAPSADPRAAQAPEAATQALAPIYGRQKYRVGVQVEDGSWVPEGTTTVGARIRVVETGPNVRGGRQAFTCTTQAGTVTEGSTASYCTTDAADRPGARGVEPGDASIPPDQLFTAAAGSKVVITQTRATRYLALDTTLSPYTLRPCEQDDANQQSCPGDGVLGDKVTSITFDDPGRPPVAVDDRARTAPSTPVDIAVLRNDSDGDGAPLTGFTLVSGPGHGTATLPEGGGEGPARAVPTGPSFTYTPAAGFTGTDTFRYRIRTQNGSSIATVTVLVGSPAAPSTPSSPSTAAADPRPAALPDTGGPSGLLAGLGLALVAAGGALSALGRRPRGDAGA